MCVNLSLICQNLQRNRIENKIILRFHPIESGENRDCTIIEDCPVYVDDESPYRFVPYLPPFKGLPRGWFMFEDLMKIFPISLFFLIAAPKTKVLCIFLVKELYNYLNIITFRINIYFFLNFSLMV